ncbi:hypothetical protein EEB18_018550 [Sphingopyxis sp. OPL5]|uniref:hypothetical protein n=1 Tax=Sphingopyxis sp. OPL5 TaxID=2486273 RepID=UPI00164DC766|nr:hypothetical protein [Sphingopyxis sp. OPL5]QNO26707.1 hypothetical protein EEB18_018550 [Sphingopyxis sp. OPL5]
MTNQELADHLNEAVGLTGKEAVTVNVVRQWVGWDVLPKAQPIGQAFGKAPEWARQDTGLERAVRLSELRKLGIRRKNAVVAQAYFEWGHPDFELAREAVVSEFIKWREQLNRRQTTTLGGKNFQEVSSAKKRAIKTQLGPLDQRFVDAPFEQAPELYALFADAARTGQVEASQIAALLAEGLEKIDPKIANLMPRKDLLAFASATAGLTGYQDEIANSGEETLINAAAEQFEKARQLNKIMTNISIPPDVEAVAAQTAKNLQNLIDIRMQLHSQISIGPWAIFQFAGILHSIVNDPNFGQKLTDFARIC